MTIRIGVDVGGTFTDFALVDDRRGVVRTEKLLTTPRDPSVAILAGLAALASDEGGLERVDLTVHGTTLVTNAVIERRGATTALITTRGFRDVLELGREHRFDIYDWNLEFPEPLVSRDRRWELDERMSPVGDVVVPLSPDAIPPLVEKLKQLGVESVAVSLLHSFANPAHEKIVGDVFQRLMPQVSVSLSSEVVPAIGEYERTSTTVVNAYVRPVVHRYLDRLTRELDARGFRGGLYLMHSNGGILQVDTAKRYPVRLIESGPAAGALVAAWVATHAGVGRALSFDLGGTTAKACYIDDGAPVTTTEFEAARVYRFKAGSGIPIRVPVIELIEVGAGGGSIARVNELGLLKVGPDSAGAEPGPACYGQGGTYPTVTDGDLLLGYLNPHYFLGGRMALSTDRASDAVRRHLAEPLGISVERAAWGIHDVVNHNMASSARIHGLESGRDPRSYTLVAFGGAGPTHACGVAQQLGVRRVLVPYGAGVASSFGLLLAPLSFDFVRTHVTSLSAVDLERVNAIYQDMETAARALMAAAGIAGDEATLTRTADLRFEGQGYDITVAIPHGTLAANAVAEIARRFRSEYERIYGRLSRAEIEAVSWRMNVSGARTGLPLFAPDGLGHPPKRAARRTFFNELGFIDCPVHHRAHLAPGATLTGPAIVEEPESTALVPPDARLEVDAHWNLVIELPNGGPS